jgi:Transposase and inactivated derivatives
LQESLRSTGDTEALKTIISPTHKLSVRKQCKLLGVNRSTFYYKPIEEREENVSIMHELDREYMHHPTKGVISMVDHLRSTGFSAGEKRVRRLLRKMGIMAIYPTRKLSKPGLSKFVHPYRLRGLDIYKSNQVWSIDITYIPMERGFMYLTAIIDVYSRYIVGWNLSNTLCADNAHNTLKEAIYRYGTPEIINSDQGSQFTAHKWVDYLNQKNITISMDGKGRALDNIWIERFWRTIKYEYIYLNPADDGIMLSKGVDEFIDYYNNKRTHQAINRNTPFQWYEYAA